MVMNEQKTRSAVLIYGDVKSPGVGYERGPVGTGFIASLTSEVGSALGTASGILSHNYVVTCAHVVRPQLARQAPIEIKTRGMGNEILLVETGDWQFPDDPKIDLAVAEFQAAIVPDGPPGDRQIVLDSCKLDDPQESITHENAAALQLGGEILYVGLLYPIEQMALAGVPMVRSGTIGALYVPEINYTIASTGEEYEYTGHLIDCRSYEGFSGSPVFMLQHFPYVQDGGPGVGPLMGLLHKVFLFAMFTGHLSDNLVPEASEDEIRSRFGVGTALPIDYIREFVMSDPDLSDNRKKREAEWAKRKKKSPFSATGRGDASVESSSGVTRTEFFSDLKKVTRPEESPEQEG
jgi:hypothetical protein